MSDMSARRRRSVLWRQPPPDRSHCKHCGAPLYGANLIIRKDGRKQCRTCRNEYHRRYYYAHLDYYRELYRRRRAAQAAPGPDAREEG